MITFLDLGNYGRLGNQMWQIASTIGIAESLNTSWVFPDWKYRDCFSLGNKISGLQRLPDNLKTWIEEEPYYQFPKLDIYYNWNLKGYFQSPKYFERVEELITKIFGFGYRVPVNKTSIHIRRGDYVNLSHIHIDLSKTDYYEKAISLFPEEERFEIYSDDLNFADEFIGKVVGKLQRDKSNFTLMITPDEFEAMKNMSSCQNHIIANSSFSWWAAYLGVNQHTKRVIAPSRWVTNEYKNDRLVKGWEIINI